MISRRSDRRESNVKRESPTLFFYKSSIGNYCRNTVHSYLIRVQASCDTMISHGIRFVGMNFFSYFGHMFNCTLFQYANILYLDTPSNVGFSRANRTIASYNDVTTAELNMKALEAFMTRLVYFENVFHPCSPH